MRSRVFYALAALNEAIAECLADLNRRVMRDYGKSGVALFEGTERAAAVRMGLIATRCAGKWEL